VRERLGLVCLGAAVIAGRGLCRRHVEQLAGSGDVVGAGAAGEQSVVADAVEAERQDVDEKAADLYMRPFTTSRMITVRLSPPRLPGGINGSTSFHSSSVRSLG
jgi:hypothetical protein